jgi:hypothetical protein
VDHRLLVAALVIGQGSRFGELGLQQGLPHAREVAVPEDAQAAREEPVLRAVALGHLSGEEPDDRLRDGQPDGTGHDRLPPAASGSRTSTGCPGQVPRTHAWAGSSQMSQARSAAGPAMTFR